MGSMRNGWQECKSALQSAGVSNSLFTLDLGPKLDSYDDSVAKYDSARTTGARSDPKVVALATAVRQSCTNLLPAAVSYEQHVRYLVEHSTDTRQKPALQKAASWLFSLIDAVRVKLKTLPA